MARHGGNPSLGAGYVPAPAWLKANESMRTLFMDIQPMSAYVEGCYPDPSNCSEVTTVTAAADKPYVDWGLGPSGEPVAVAATGRKGANVWRGLPKESGMLCTSCGGGVRLGLGGIIALCHRSST
jgi:hypothetical protein